MSSDVWPQLLAGVERSSERRAAGVPEHRPAAVILTCSDARVAPSIIFDQPAGQLFVVRVAGNTLSPAARASLEYAVTELGSAAIVVLGHTHCGAVAAAAAGVCTGSLSPVTEPICEFAAAYPDASPAELERLNVQFTVDAIGSDPGALGDSVRAGHVDLRGAIYDLHSGHVDELVRMSPLSS
jgi:carbonic anhydrase